MSVKSVNFQTFLFEGRPNYKKPIYMLERIALKPEHVEPPKFYSNQMILWQALNSSSLVYHVTRKAGEAYPRRLLKGYRTWYRLLKQLKEGTEKEIYIDCWPKHDMSEAAQIQSYRLSHYEYQSK